MVLIGRSDEIGITQIKHIFQFHYSLSIIIDISLRVFAFFFSLAVYFKPVLIGPSIEKNFKAGKPFVTSNSICPDKFQSVADMKISVNIRQGGRDVKSFRHLNGQGFSSSQGRSCIQTERRRQGQPKSIPKNQPIENQLKRRG